MILDNVNYWFIIIIIDYSFLLAPEVLLEDLWPVPSRPVLSLRGNPKEWGALIQILY